MKRPPVHAPSGAAALVVVLFAATAHAQQEAQFLDSPVIAVPDAQQRMNAILDLDGDGWTDAVGTFWPTTSTVGVYGFRNDGAGRLVPLFEHEWTQYGDNDLPAVVDVGDFDGDGRDDFAVAVRDELLVFTSNGAAPPTLVHQIYLGSGFEAHDLRVGDYDGDGDPDVALRLYKPLGGGFLDKGLRVYLDVLAAPGVYHAALAPAGAGLDLENVDADGDAAMDLMCVGPNAVDFFTVGTSGIVHLGPLTHGLGPAYVASDDVDGDGDDDVVVFGMSGTYRILRKTGPMQFSVEAPAIGGPATGLADVDGDGDVDGVCCGGGGGPSTFVEFGKSFFEIAINDGTGAFAPSFKLPSMGANRIAGVADIDKDGDADLIAGRIVYYNRRGIQPVQSFELAAYAPYARDLDGDGDADLEGDLDGFRANQGDGTFATVPRVTVAPPAGSTFEGPGYLGDFDGDGDQDLIVHEHAAQGTRERLLRNNGGGLSDGGPVTDFGVHFGGKADSESAWTADVDGDGRNDIIVRDAFPLAPAFRVYRDDGAGKYAISAAYPERLLAMGDLDGDGRADLVVDDKTITKVRFGDSGGAMGIAVPLRDPTPAPQIHWAPGTLVADLDGDGDEDVLVAVPANTELEYVARIAENVGGRQFAFHDGLFPGYRGAFVPAFARDVDGDGAVDVLIGQNRAATDSIYPVDGLSVFLGSSGPGMSFSYPGDQWPLAWTLTDLDGDGDDDAMSGTGVYYGNSVDSPAESLRRQYGQATPGSGGQRPTFGAVGPFFGGAPIELRITGAAPNAPGILFVGLSDGAALISGTGGFLSVLPVAVAVPVVFPGDPGESGSGGLSLSFTVPAAAVGFHFFHQVVVIDPGAQGGAAVSNGLELFYGK